MKKEEWMNKGKELQAKFDEAQAKFDANPCTKTATALSNIREELKKHIRNGYDGRDEEYSRRLAKDIAQILAYANGQSETLPALIPILQ